MTAITDRRALDRASARLAGAAPDLAGLLADYSPLPLRLKSPGFAAMLDIIAGQQVSTASAAAILARLAAAGLSDEAAVRRAGPDELTGCGLSRPKARHVHAIARARIDWAGLAGLGDDQARAVLVALPGVGPWSAEIYLLSALGRADAWPAGDLALQEAARMHFGLTVRPDAAAMGALAEPWRPWRSVAARAFWAYYRAAKGRDGIR